MAVGSSTARRRPRDGHVCAPSAVKGAVTLHIVCLAGLFLFSIVAPPHSIGVFSLPSIATPEGSGRSGGTTNSVRIYEYTSTTQIGHSSDYSDGSNGQDSTEPMLDLSSSSPPTKGHIVTISGRVVVGQSSNDLAGGGKRNPDSDGDGATTLSARSSGQASTHWLALENLTVSHVIEGDEAAKHAKAHQNLRGHVSNHYANFTRL